MASGSRQPRKGAPNAGSGKRAWRTPIPHLSLSDRKVGQGLIVCTTKTHRTSNAQHRIKNKSLNLRFVGRSEFVVGCWMLDVFQFSEKLLARQPYSAQLDTNNLTTKKIWDASTTTSLKPSATRRWSN